MRSHHALMLFVSVVLHRLKHWERRELTAVTPGNADPCANPNILGSQIRHQARSLVKLHDRNHIRRLQFVGDSYSNCGHRVHRPESRTYYPFDRTGLALKAIWARIHLIVTTLRTELETEFVVAGSIPKGPGEGVAVVEQLSHGPRQRSPPRIRTHRSRARPQDVPRVLDGCLPPL